MQRFPNWLIWVVNLCNSVSMSHPWLNSMDALLGFEFVLRVQVHLLQGLIIKLTCFQFKLQCIRLLSVADKSIIRITEVSGRSVSICVFCIWHVSLVHCYPACACRTGCSSFLRWSGTGTQYDLHQRGRSQQDHNRLSPMAFFSPRRFGGASPFPSAIH